MARHQYKWAYALEHGLPAAKGWLRLLIQKPGWALRLLRARTQFFLTRRFSGPLRTPDEFLIESPHQLVSYWSLFIEHECWSSEWISALKADPAPLILDVGANAGLFTHLVWSKRPDADFMAFEPLPRMGDKIMNWKDKTGARLTLHRTAVSDHTGAATFYASEEDDPTASLKPEGKNCAALSVPLTTLDSVVPARPILLIKIDVEGCECEVLAGAKETIGRARFLIIEAHTPEALKKIQRQLGEAWRSTRVGASDFLFTRGDPQNQ